METTSKRLGPPGYTQWKDYSTIPAAKIMIGVAIAGAFAYILAWFGEWVPINDGLSGKEFSAFASKAMRFIYDDPWSMSVLVLINSLKIIAIGAVISLIPLFAKWRLLSILYLICLAIFSIVLMLQGFRSISDEKHPAALHVFLVILVIACVIGVITALVSLYRKHKTDTVVFQAN